MSIIQNTRKSFEKKHVKGVEEKDKKHQYAREQYRILSTWS